MRSATGTQRLVLASCMKDEGPFILEHIAHHISCGFTEIFIASNPSDDGTRELLSVLDHHGYINHFPVDPPHDAFPQTYSYEEMIPQIDLASIDWLMLLDADEYLNIHSPLGVIQELTRPLEADVDVISINWACFGHYPEEIWRPGSSREMFRYRLRSFHSQNGTGKSLIRRPERFERFGNHGPSRFEKDRPVVVALHGGLNTIQIRDDHTLVKKLRYPGPGPHVHSLAQINHYLIRTWDSYQLRVLRGRGMQIYGKPDLRHTANYFNISSRGRFLDESVLLYNKRKSPRATKLLKTPDIIAAHENCISIYADKIRQLSYRES